MDQVTECVQKEVTRRSRGRLPVFNGDQRVCEWEQELDDVHIYFKDKLFSIVDASASLWMLEDGELHIQLCKMKKGEVWECPIKGFMKMDEATQQEVKKKLMLERFGEEHPGFDFSGATFSGNAPDPRTFMGGVRYT